MTSEQKILKEYLEARMMIFNNDMQRILSSMGRSINVPTNVKIAMGKLSVKQKNQVICELLLPF